MPAVDDHVGMDWHVAGCTGDRRIYAFVVTVPCGGIFGCGMALQADIVPRKAKFSTVWIMAITARNSRRKHFALFERTIIVGLFIIPHLAVCKIQFARQRRHNMCI
jgi:hypothetical protein